MKAKVFIALLVVSMLGACSGKQVDKDKTTNQVNNKQIENAQVVENDKINQEDKIIDKKDKQNNNENQDIRGELLTNKIDNPKKQFKKIEKKYLKRIKIQTAGIEDEQIRLSVMVNTDCKQLCYTGKNPTQADIQASKKCYQVCEYKRKQAKKQLDELMNNLKKMAQAYPAKCITEAKKQYQKYLKFVKNTTKDKLPPSFKIPSEKEFVNVSANQCLLIYGFTNYNCNKIKQYTGAYRKCNRLMQLRSDMEFLKRWNWKTFDDYLKEKMKNKQGF